MITKHNTHKTHKTQTIKETNNKVRMVFDINLGKLRPMIHPTMRNVLSAETIRTIRTLYREQPHMTQQKIADYVGVSYPSVNKYVRPVSNYKRPSRWLRFNTKTGNVHK